MSSREERHKNRLRVREETETPTPRQSRRRSNRQFNRTAAEQENPASIGIPQGEEKHEDEAQEQNENEPSVENLNFDEISEPPSTSNSDDTPVRDPQGIDPQQLAAIVRALQPIMPQQRPQAQSQSFNIKPYGKIIDTSTKQGSELYSQAIKRFDPLYDGSEEHLHTFIDKVKH